MSRRPAPPSVTALVAVLALGCLGCGLFAGPPAGARDAAGIEVEVEREAPPSPDVGAEARGSEGALDAHGARREPAGGTSAAWFRASGADRRQPE